MGTLPRLDSFEIAPLFDEKVDASDESVNFSDAKVDMFDGKVDLSDGKHIFNLFYAGPERSREVPVGVCSLKYVEF